MSADKNTVSTASAEIESPASTSPAKVEDATKAKKAVVKGVKLPRRSTYFVEDDIVWVKPPRLPLWPAEVIRTEKEGSVVVCRLFCAPEGVEPIVTTPGRAHLYFFDKMVAEDEIESCIEERLHRKRHSVDHYEKDFRKAVSIANGLMRTVLSPSKLQPFEVAGVGIVHSLMRTHISAPRQPMTGKFEPQPAVIVLRPELANAARDLKGFDWVWILFHFSYATMLGDSDAAASGAVPPTPAAPKPTNSDYPRLPPTKGEIMAAKWKTTVIPPRDTKMRGVFSTRSPHRPNGIGLSCVRLVDVQGLCVHIADHDLLHGTPVLDIKPYLPFCDSHPDARAGWVSELDESGLAGDDHKAGVAIPVHRTYPDARNKNTSSSSTDKPNTSE